jgi:hypothetical protein
MKTIEECFANVTLPTSKYDTYCAVYDKLFGCYRGEKITFVEVGVLGGGSLQAWRDYFGPAARIVGVDLNPAIAPLLMADGFEIQIGDQASPAF